MNCVFVEGLKSGRADKSMDLVGSLLSDITEAFGAERFLFRSMSPKRSSACLRSESFSVCLRRSRCSAASSSSSLDSSSNSWRRRRDAS